MPEGGGPFIRSDDPELFDRIDREQQAHWEARRRYESNPSPPAVIDDAILKIIGDRRVPYDERVWANQAPDVRSMSLAFDNLRPRHPYGATLEELVEEVDRVIPGITVGNVGKAVEPHLKRRFPELAQHEIDNILIGSPRDVQEGGDVHRRLDALLRSGRLDLELFEVPAMPDFCRSYRQLILVLPSRLSGRSESMKSTTTPVNAGERAVQSMDDHTQSSETVREVARALLDYIEPRYDPATGTMPRHVDEKFGKFGAQVYYLENEIPKLIYLVFDNWNLTTQLQRDGWRALCDAVDFPMENLGQPCRTVGLAPYLFDSPKVAIVIPKLLHALRMLAEPTEQPKSFEHLISETKPPDQRPVTNNESSVPIAASTPPSNNVQPQQPPAITDRQRTILVELNEVWPQVLPIAQIAKRLTIKARRVSHDIDDLRKAGLVHFPLGKGKGKGATLTEQGRSYAQTYLPESAP